MSKKYLGTEYGGWMVDLDLINDGDVIIDAGLGTDISFLQELNKMKKVSIIGVDPTEKSHKYIGSLNLPNIKLFKKAISPFGETSRNIFKNSNPNHVSESFFYGHTSIDKSQFYLASCISFKELISEFSPSLVKMDIEGAEFETLLECFGVQQICVEFHHHCMEGKSENDRDNLLKHFTSQGYEILDNRNGIEFTLVLKKRN
jgi:FkbM family methyltransferase